MTGRSHPQGHTLHYIHQVLVSHELGGAGILALRLAEFLQTRGQATRVWIPGAGPAHEKARALGLTPHLYDAHSVFQTSRLRAAAGNYSLARALRRFRPGIVHVHSPLYYGAMQFGIRGSGLKSVVHVHITTPLEALQWAFKHPPALIVTCAQYLVEEIRQALPPAHRGQQWIECVSNTVDLERFCPGDKTAAKQHVGAPLDAPLGLMLANLAPHKGQETAIRVVATFKQAGVRIVLWLAGVERGGDGTYTAHLRALCNTLGVADRVHFLGQRQDAPDLLRAADFFLLPSTSEGLPLSILEAQAARLPVLAAPTAGIPEVVAHAKTGFLIPAHDIMGYAQCIKMLLDDPSLACRISAQAYARVIRESNWQSGCTRMETLYKQLQEYSRTDEVTCGVRSSL